MSVTEVRAAPRWRPIALWTVTELPGPTIPAIVLFVLAAIVPFAGRNRLHAAIASR